MRVDRADDFDTSLPLELPSSKGVVRHTLLAAIRLWRVHNAQCKPDIILALLQSQSLIIRIRQKLPSPEGGRFRLNKTFGVEQMYDVNVMAIFVCCFCDGAAI